MLTWISKLLYFAILWALIGYIALHSFIWSTSFHLWIFPLFAIALLPLYDMLHETIRCDSDYKARHNPLVFWSTLGIILLVLLWVYLAWFDSPLIYILAYMWLSIYYRCDTRIFFLGALWIFAFVALSLLLDAQQYAESLSIIAYYFLVAGVILQIIDSFWSQKQTTQNTLERNSSTPKLPQNLSKNTISTIIYAWFIVLTLWLLEWFILQTLSFLWIVTGLYYLLYSIWKFYWFRLDYAAERRGLRDITALRLFALGYAVFLILFSLLLNSSSLGSQSFGSYHILVSVVYLFIGMLLFLDIPFLQNKKNWVYNSLSFAVLLWLIWVLGYNSFFSIPQASAPISSSEEESEQIIPDPVVVLDEEIIDDQVPEQQEMVPVSQEYTLISGLREWSVGSWVSDLQEVLSLAWYYQWDINGEFDEDVRIALRSALIESCDWPESTQWIFGPQSKECIDEMLIPIKLATN